MGNCLFGGGGGGGIGPIIGISMENGSSAEVIRVVTANGGIMEFCSPITVEFITDEFPGQGIFRSHDLFWKPLAHHQVLEAGECYYLLPLDLDDTHDHNMISIVPDVNYKSNGHVRSKSVAQIHQSMLQAAPAPAPYRMSFDSQGILKRSHTSRADHHQVLSRCCSSINGFWKVKLVISPGHLLEILSQEGRTQELIESVRTVAKCRNGHSSVVFSDQWSLSGGSNSRK